eukprot:TRINITY_DN4212_c0_g2_i1.p1 TRINITY_DN4212_c0_g2~~TRINITY_DN4212_c0_g2_i1.p1  ORF type:complete len:118 (+),score=24.34 TRINITY_DN4212_c0_g2_i1:205-558(+)
MLRQRREENSGHVSWMDSNPNSHAEILSGEYMRKGVNTLVDYLFFRMAPFAVVPVFSSVYLERYMGARELRSRMDQWNNQLEAAQKQAWATFREKQAQQQSQEVKPTATTKKASSWW